MVVCPMSGIDVRDVAAHDLRMSTFLRFSPAAFRKPHRGRRAGTLAAVLAGVVACVAQVHAENLDQAFAAALAADRRLAASNHQVSAAEAGANAAHAAAMPNLSADSAYLRLDREPAAVVNLAPLPRTELPFAQDEALAYRIGVSVPLYTGGRIASGARAADETLAAARTETTRTEQDVKLNVAEAYTNVLRAQRLLELADSGVQTLEAHERDVANLFQQGLVAKTDLLAVRVALANARQDRIRADNAVDLSRAAYNRLLGRALDAPVALDDVAPLAAPGPLEAVSARALTGRAELAGLEHQRSALEEQSSAVRGGGLPQLVFTAGYAHLDNRYLAREGGWSAMLGLHWDLFDGGLIRSQAGAIAAKAQAVDALREDARSQIALQVRAAWLAVGESASRVEVAQATVEQADENLRVARDRYQSGVGTNTEVLDAETLRVKSRSNWFNAIYDNVFAGLRLKRAAGEL